MCITSQRAILPAKQPTKESANHTKLANVQMCMLFSTVSFSISQSRSDVGFKTKMLDYSGNNEMNVVERVYDDDDGENETKKK